MSRTRYTNEALVLAASKLTTIPGLEERIRLLLIIFVLYGERVAMRNGTLGRLFGVKWC